MLFGFWIFTESLFSLSNFGSEFSQNLFSPVNFLSWKQLEDILFLR